jgi:hypothetical protein
VVGPREWIKLRLYAGIGKAAIESRDHFFVRSVRSLAAANIVRRSGINRGDPVEDPTPASPGVCFERSPSGSPRRLRTRAGERVTRRHERTLLPDGG